MKKLFVCPKTVYHTIRKFLNTGEVKSMPLAGSVNWERNFISLQREYYNGLSASNTADTAT